MSKILTRALNLSGASAIAQVMLILSTPIITRLYSPEDFSFYAIIISFSLLVIPLSNMKYELALPLIQSKNNVHLSRLSLKFNLLAFLILSFVFFLLSFMKFENDSTNSDTTHIFADEILLLDMDSTSTIEGIQNVTVWTPKFSSLSDTLFYDSKSEIFTLNGSPRSWNKQTQLTGPYIIVELDSSEIKQLSSFPNAFSIFLIPLIISAKPKISIDAA